MIHSDCGFMIRSGAGIVSCRSVTVGVRRMVSDSDEISGLTDFRPGSIIIRRVTTIRR